MDKPNWLRSDSITGRESPSWPSITGAVGAAEGSPLQIMSSGVNTRTPGWDASSSSAPPRLHSATSRSSCGSGRCSSLHISARRSRWSTELACQRASPRRRVRPSSNPSTSTSATSSRHQRPTVIAGASSPALIIRTVVIPCCPLEDPADMSPPAAGHPLLHRGALPALHEIGVFAQHREPERQVRVRDLVHRISGPRRAVGTHRPDVPGAAQPVESVVDPLLCPSRDPRASARAGPQRTQHPLVAATPVEVLAEDVEGVAQQQPTRRERQCICSITDTAEPVRASKMRNPVDRVPQAGRALEHPQRLSRARSYRAGSSRRSHSPRSAGSSA